MGHKVNPLVFRLGGSNSWTYNLKEKKNWITNYLIYQLVSNQFLRYTVPHFNHEKTRNTRHDTGLVKMKGEKQLRSNNFIKRSILFSHLFVGSLNSELKISCFFYDYRMGFRNRVHDFYHYNQLFCNTYLRWNAYHLFLNKTLDKHPRKAKRLLKYMLPNIWMLNLNLYTVQANHRSNLIQLFKLSKIWLRLLKSVKYSTKVMNIFFLNVWSYLISNMIPVMKSLGMPRLANRLCLVLIQINLFNFQQKLNTSLFFLKIFRTRYFIFKGVSKSISQNLKSMLPSCKGVVLNFHAIRERKMTSSLLTNLIIIKLGQYFRINSILYPLTGWIKRHKNVLGYRIIISGRLTRRERASHMIKSGKSMPLSSYRHKIDYNQDIKIMKFGMVGIKVYLFLRKKMRNSYYFFKFIC